MPTRFTVELGDQDQVTALAYAGRVASRIDATLVLARRPAVALAPDEAARRFWEPHLEKPPA